VILAVPYAEAAGIVAGYGEKLKEKIVVDITNPVDFSTFELVTPPGSSGAEEIAKSLPEGAKIVKAFNTTLAGTLVAGQVDGQPLDVLVAGDDAEAKGIIIKLAVDGKLRGLDAGPLRRAHHLEALQLLHMSLQDQLKSNWMSTVKFLS
jgi:predicted dinucleotide-binding enzyme